jgi:hypothetical protein
LPKEVNWAIRVPPDKSDDELSYFDEMLHRLCAEHGAEVVYSRSYYEAGRREQIRYDRRVHEYMRREARRVIRKIKRETLKGRPRHISGRDWKRQRWLYAPEETEINDNADMERIEEVLGFVGRPDEFEQIRDDAFRKA